MAVDEARLLPLGLWILEAAARAKAEGRAQQGFLQSHVFCTCGAAVAPPAACAAVCATLPLYILRKPITTPRSRCGTA
jgi:hypothetical protein